MLRTLLGDVTITPSTQDRAQLQVGLRWMSDAAEHRQVTRRTSAIRLHNTDPAAIALARRIGPGIDNASLAAALDTAGYTTGTGQPFDAASAANVRHSHRIGYPDLLADGERLHARLSGHCRSLGTRRWRTTAGRLGRRLLRPGCSYAVTSAPPDEAQSKSIRSRRTLLILFGRG